jgi:DNA-binding NarL/FixJ family response regulator
VTVRLLLVSDSTLTGLGLTAALRGDPDIVLTGLVDSAARGRLAAAELRPDVVVVDVALPDEDGLRLAAELRQNAPGMGVVLIAPRDDDRLIRALEAGISAYVPTNAPIEVVLSAFRHAAVAPASFTAPDLAQALARHRRQQQLLSPREGEVLRMLHSGASVPQIAETMLVSESTIKTYLSRLYDKLGVNNRAQALAVATRAGLIADQAVNAGRAPSSRP